MSEGNDRNGGEPGAQAPEADDRVASPVPSPSPAPAPRRRRKPKTRTANKIWQQRRTHVAAFAIVAFALYSLFLYGAAAYDLAFVGGEAANMPNLDRLVSMAQVGSGGKLVLPVGALLVALLSFFMEKRISAFVFWLTVGAVALSLVAAIYLYFGIGGVTFRRDTFAGFSEISAQLGEIVTNNDLTSAEVETGREGVLTGGYDKLVGAILFGFLWNSSVILSIVKNQVSTSFIKDFLGINIGGSAA
jgi:hypothetical protein